MLFGRVGVVGLGGCGWADVVGMDGWMFLVGVGIVCKGGYFC